MRTTGFESTGSTDESIALARIPQQESAHHRFQHRADGFKRAWRFKQAFRIMSTEKIIMVVLCGLFFLIPVWATLRQRRRERNGEEPASIAGAQDLGAEPRQPDAKPKAGGTKSS